MSLVYFNSPSILTYTSLRKLRSSFLPMTYLWFFFRCTRPPLFAFLSAHRKSSLISSVSFFDARIVTFLRSCATALPQLSFCLGFLARMESGRAASTEAPAGMKSLSKGDAVTEAREAARARSREIDLMLPSGAQVVSEGLLISLEMQDHLIVLHELKYQLRIYWQFLVPRTKMP